MGNKSHVKVFVRTRPTARPYEGLKLQSKDGQTITVAFPKQDDCLINNQLESLTFKFDGVLENVSQDVVYNTCVQEAVDSSLAGYNSTVFAYGQTGAGKTFTMSGDARNYAHRGIIPRALQHVFRNVDMRTDRIYSISVSYMEIYNESLRDLLSSDPSAGDSLAILDDAATTVVRGLTMVPVSSEEEALRQFFLGEQARSTAQHALNTNSSRSHALFTLHIEMRASAEAEERALLSKLHLVDLAGSERIKKTQAAAGGRDANYEQLRESSCINKSLSFLEQVVNALARRDAHVPFRQSKLTAALRDAIGGNSNTVMIANLWPEEAHLEECVSTLRFAARVRCLQTDAQVNESGDPLLALKKAERQIRELRQELAMRDMLSGRGRVVYEDLSDGECLELQQLVLRYLSGAAELDELPTDSLKRIRETYKAFKAVSSSWAAAAAQGDPARTSQHSAAGAGGGDDLEAAGVGDVDAAASGGFCIGTAPLFARPPGTPPGHTAAQPAAAAPAGAPAPLSSRGSSPAPYGANFNGQSKQQQQQQQQQQQNMQQQQQQQQNMQQQQQQQRSATQQSPRPGTSGTNGSAAFGDSSGAELGVDHNALFSKYKHTTAQGRQQAETVRQQQQLVAQLKQELKVGGAEVNAAKADIDEVAEHVDARKRAAGAGDVLDEEQQQLLQELKAAKARYRTLYESLQEVRSSCDAAVGGLAAAKEALLAGFNQWADQQAAQGSHAAAGGDSAYAAGDGADLDPAEAWECADLARKAAATGDPGSTAFFAARKHTSKVLGTRQPGRQQQL